MKSILIRFCKQITPPVIWNLVRRSVVPEPERITYTGTFPSFAAVSASFPDTTNYHSDQSERTEIDEARCKLARFEANQVPEYGPTLPRLNFLPTALSLLQRSNLKILDVGGGLGTTFIDLKFSLPTTRVEVTVVELPSIAENARKIFEKYPDISFVSTFPEKGTDFDIVYFGSSLQYFENYNEVLMNSASLEPEFMVIADTTMGPAQSFACAQVNMHGRVIPRMVFYKPEMIETLGRLGYKLVHQSANYSPVHTFDNYEPPARLTGHWNLMFQFKV